ncbi:MAG TPA: hypothetical protein VKE69_06675, partial [Planctomycetota bacterium]|nr:hypothetical protein [Planctomycetota bacterium]
MPSPRTPTTAPVDQGPGAAMRALEAEQRRQRRRRRNRRLAIVAAIVAVVAYLAVTTFVFNPLEGTFIPFPNAIPRASDFFIRKIDLADNLPFPATEATPFREDARLWKAFEAGKL